MSYKGARVTRHRVSNYTPTSYAAQHAGTYQQSFRSTDYQPSQQQADEEANAIIPKPINVPSLQDQDQQFVNKLFLETKNSQYSYAGISGTGKVGVSMKKRVQMGFSSGLKEEIAYSLRTLTELSYYSPSAFPLKDNPHIVSSLVSYLDCTKLSSSYQSEELRAMPPTNDDLNFSLDAALALRNFSQIIENSSILSANSFLKEILLKILNNTSVEDYSIGDENYEAATELLVYAVDIVESISSYLAVAARDDALFMSLVALLQNTEDRYMTVSILRSLSRLLVRSTPDTPSAADNVEDDILDRISSYLLASSPMTIPDSKNDELLLASIDFLYQYCLPGGERIHKMLSSERRASLLRTMLSNLLTYGVLDSVSEASDQINPKRKLKLVKRVKNDPPTKAPELRSKLFDEVNDMDEPDRATTWMRCCYEPSEKDEVTQISLWRAYEAAFGRSRSEAMDSTPSKKLLAAVDFIKNVSNAFPNSAARVITLDNQGGKKFVITGIRPRRFPVSVDDGNADATKTPDATDIEADDTDEEVQAELENSEQSTFALVNYADNEAIPLSEINTSSALLLNCLTKTELGNKLFQGKKDDILGKVMIAPALFSHVFETLEFLDY